MKKLILLFAFIFCFSCYGQYDFKQPFHNFAINGIVELNNKIFVSTESSGVWVSNDRCKSFERITFYDEYYNTPNYGNLVKFHDYLVLHSREKIFISKDEFKTWDIYKYKNFKISNNVAYMINDANLYYSDNDSLSWKKFDINRDVSDYFVMEDTIGAFNYSDSLISLSTDKGKTWNLTDNKFKCIYPNIIFKNNIISAQNSDTLLISRDKGKSWENIKADVDENKIWQINQIRDTLILICVCKGPYNEDSVPVFISTDFGKTCKIITKDKFKYIYTAILKKDSTTYLGNYGLHISFDNENTWFSPNTGLTCPRVNDIFSDNNYILVSTIDRGIYKSTDLGLTWKLCNMPLTDGGIFSVIKINGKELYAITGICGLFKSTDEGDNWECVNPDIRHIRRISYIDSIMYGYGFTSGVFCSKNKGITWFNADIPLFENGLSTLIDADSMVLALKNNKLYYSKDSCKSFNLMSSATGSLLKREKDTLFLWQNDKLIFSADNGNSWNDTRYMYEGTVNFSVFNNWIKNSNILVFLSGKAGNKIIYISIDYGKTWSTFYKFGDNMICMLTINNLLLIGSSSQGIITLDLTPLLETADVTEKAEINKNDIKVYPNPTKDFINYNINILNDDYICIEIYDISGKLLKEYNHGFLSQGQHTLFCPVYDLSSGQYILSVNVGNEKLQSVFEIIR